jgi:hypothetical protein
VRYRFSTGPTTAENADLSIECEGFDATWPIQRHVSVTKTFN